MSTHSAAVADPRHALRSLRKRWLFTAGLYVAALIAGYGFLDWAWSAGHAVWWLGWAAAATLVELGILWWILPHNHRKASPRLLPTFGYGTALTLVCGLLLVLLAGFLFAPRPSGLLAWIPPLLYTAARLVDYIDGYIARITDHETELGGILDMEFDGLGVLIAVLLGIQYGALPLWYLPLALSRQLFIGGLWWRSRRGLPVYEMTPSANRRIIAGYQTAFISVALWPIFLPPVSTLAAVIFALPLIASFLRDWLVVSGALDPATAMYQRTRTRVKELIEGWLPLVARLAGGGIAALLLVRHIPLWQAHLAEQGVGPLGSATLIGLAVVALLPYVLGVLGRVAALPLMVLAWMDIAAAGLSWQDNAWLFIAAAIVTHAGSGRFALWQPEEAILHRRPGRSRSETAS